MKIYRLIQLICFSALLAACSNDNLVNVDSTVYIPQSGFSSQSVLLGESTYNLKIYKSSYGEGDAGVNVKVAVDKSAWETFQQQNPAYAGYALLPEAYYSIVNENVNIGKGNYDGSFKIVLKGIDANFVNTNYVLPVSIQSVSDGAKVNGEKSVAFLNFNRYRNSYEGLHKAYGKSEGEDGIVSQIDKEKVLESAGEKSVTTYMANNTTVKMKLTVDSNGNVTVEAAPGFENYNIRNDESQKSTYTGGFSDLYQRNKGVYNLSYKYDISTTIGGTVFKTTYSVTEELKFWM